MDNRLHNARRCRMRGSARAFQLSWPLTTPSLRMRISVTIGNASLRPCGSGWIRAGVTEVHVHRDEHRTAVTLRPAEHRRPHDAIPVPGGPHRRTVTRRGPPPGRVSTSPRRETSTPATAPTSAVITSSTCSRHIDRRARSQPAVPIPKAEPEGPLLRVSLLQCCANSRSRYRFLLNLLCMGDVSVLEGRCAAGFGR